MEDITSFAFAGLFSLFLLSLNFSFLLHMRLKQMNKKFDEMEEKLNKSKETDKLIVEELDDLVRLMEKIEPALDKVITKND